jgi:limonene-1,2-epoxide hydrolase
MQHEVHRMAADGNVVITEHTETWNWPTGERVSLPFCSVHEIRDGRIVVWNDYWDLATLMNAAPQWWLEHIMSHTEADFA